MIVWPVVVGKFLILEAGVDRVAAELSDRPANGSDSANRSRRSLTCLWLREEDPAQPSALDHISTSFLIAASPDAAPEESRWSPQPRSGEEERP